MSIYSIIFIRMGNLIKWQQVRIHWKCQQTLQEKVFLNLHFWKLMRLCCKNCTIHGTYVRMFIQTWWTRVNAADISLFRYYFFINLKFCRLADGINGVLYELSKSVKGKGKYVVQYGYFKRFFGFQKEIDTRLIFDWSIALYLAQHVTSFCSRAHQYGYNNIVRLTFSIVSKFNFWEVNRFHYWI